MKRGVFLFLVCAAFYGCLEEADCVHHSSTLVNFTFKKKSNGAADTTVTLRQVEVGGTDIVYKGSGATQRLKKISMAINPFVDTTQYIFVFPKETDTLLVGYTGQASFISQDCGSEVIYNHLKVLDAGFDSLRVVNGLLNEKVTVNITIYF